MPPPEQPSHETPGSATSPKQEKPNSLERRNQTIFDQFAHIQHRIVHLALRAATLATDTTIPLSDPNHPSKPDVRELLRLLTLLNSSMKHALPELWLSQQLDVPPPAPNGELK